MQIIAVDIGNSAIKFLAGEVHLRLPHRSTESQADFADALTEYVASVGGSGPFFWSVVSVNDARCQQLADWIKQDRSKDRFEIITREGVPLDIVDSYRTSVGIDRLVVAYAAVSSQEADTPLIIVDAGTAVTIDFVSDSSADGRRRFEGGIIFPGAAACLSALNSTTADLPDVSLWSARLEESGSLEGLLGTGTNMAIANGVRLSQAHAAAGIVSAFNRLPGAEVWITGGGAKDILELLDDEVTNHWISDSQLLLRGATTIGQQVLSNENAD